MALESAFKSLPSCGHAFCKLAEAVVHTGAELLFELISSAALSGNAKPSTKKKEAREIFILTPIEVKVCLRCAGAFSFGERLTQSFPRYAQPPRSGIAGRGHPLLSVEFARLLLDVRESIKNRQIAAASP